jgi:hypothetical protein
MDLIILIFLARHIGIIARAKGLDVLRWRTIMVLVWIGLEIPVVLLSNSYTHNFLIATLSGILAGLLGYFMIRQYLERQTGTGDGHPDQLSDRD